jgi:hypothetical protein
MPAPVIFQVSRSTPFDNETNGFVSDNAQEAIEEAKSQAEGKPRSVINLINNGSLVNGQWVSYSELLPDSVIIFPFSVRITDMAWCNTNTNVSFSLEFYKNGTVVGNRYRTQAIVSGTNRYGYYNNWADDFVAGDVLRIKYIKTTNTVSDFLLNIFYLKTS